MKSAMVNVNSSNVNESIEVQSKKRITKKTMDSVFAEIISLKESKKAIDTRLKELLEVAESWYKLQASEKEVISGNEYEMSKTPINRGRNVYSPEVIHTLMSKIPVEQRVGLIVVKEEVDAKVLDKLVKSGILTENDADKARINKWTFSSKFSKKAEAVIQGNIITFNSSKKK